MLARLHVGEEEKHLVEVELSFWTGKVAVRVDGEEIHRARSFRPWFRIPFVVGDKEPHRVELAFNTFLMSSRAYVDGQLAKRSLFPQFVLYAFLLAFSMFVVGALVLVPLLRPVWAMERGHDAYDRNDYDTALAYYDQAIRLGQENATAYNNRGWAHIGKRDYDKAVADFDRAIQLDPQTAEAYLGRGQARQAKGDFHGAALDFEEALRLDPNLVEARKALGKN